MHLVALRTVCYKNEEVELISYNITAHTSMEILFLKLFCCDACSNAYLDK